MIDAQPMGTPALQRQRRNIVALSLLAAFMSNLAGAGFAVNAELFPSSPAVSQAIDTHENWLFTLPFSVAALMYLAYFLPLYRTSATQNTYRRKVLGLPLFFALATSAAWLSSFAAGMLLPLSVNPALPLREVLVWNLGVLGISLISMAIGYFLTEYLNRAYWIPRLFDNKLSAYRGIYQPPILAKFIIFYLGASLAPTMFLGWIFVWTDINHSTFSQAQYVYVLAFLVFTAIANLGITQLFARLFQVPLVQARKATDRVGRGDFDVKLTVHSSDELGLLSERINGMAAHLQGNARDIAALQAEIESTQREVVFTMGAIGESRSKETGNHVRRVAEYSYILALAAGLSEHQADLLRQASPMHDIGKLAIPDAILNKPGRLTAEEFEVMKTHAALGYEMLRHSQRELLQAAATVALHHHEKFDGSGYPRGLAGEDIHIYGRITAVADVFDALGSERVYKKAWRDEEIFALFQSQRGLHFDPQLIDLFMSNLERIFAVRARFVDLPNDTIAEVRAKVQDSWRKEHHSHRTLVAAR